MCSHSSIKVILNGIEPSLPFYFEIMLNFYIHALLSNPSRFPTMWKIVQSVT